MAWEDVPSKLADYATAEYAPEGAATKLFAEFGAVSLDTVPVHRREEFEQAVDYRLGACVNLSLSRAKRWLL